MTSDAAPLVVLLVALLVALMATLLVLPPLAESRARALRSAHRLRTPSQPSAVLRRGRDMVRRHGQSDSRDAVVELCAALTTELRCGHAPAAALANASDQLQNRGDQLGTLGQELVTIAEHARLGHDPAPALRHASGLPGAEGLSYLAACWQVSTHSGAPLTPVVTQLTDALRAELEQRRELRAHLAGPRATSILLAALPVVGLAMGAGLSTRPLVFLLTTPPGLACLFAGIALEVLGLLWTRRIVRGALGATDQPESR